MNIELNHRQRQILERVDAAGFVAIDDLAAEFRVTPQTVRRDINSLCDRGLLRRLHGGAGPPASSVRNIDYSDRRVLHPEAKQRIARAVADYIPNGSSLFINLGTTTEAVAGALCAHTNMRVITNNLNVAVLLCAQPSFEVMVTGGQVRPHDRGIVGAETADFISQFKVDFGIIGVSGIDGDGTLLDYDYREVRVAQAIIANARRVLLVADQSKFTRNPMVRLAHLSDIDVLFTDRPPPAAMNAILTAAEVEVRLPAAQCEPGAENGADKAIRAIPRATATEV